MSEILLQAGDVHARPELLVVADTVAKDKGIDREEVLEAMEMAIASAGDNSALSVSIRYNSAPP